jgi:hypothetical protein
MSNRVSRRECNCRHLKKLVNMSKQSTSTMRFHHARHLNTLINKIPSSSSLASFPSPHLDHHRIPRDDSTIVFAFVAIFTCVSMCNNAINTAIDWDPNQAPFRGALIERRTRVVSSMTRTVRGGGSLSSSAAQKKVRQYVGYQC